MELFETFGLREAVIGMAVLLGIYSGIVIIRLARLSRPKPQTAWKQDAAQFGEQVFRNGVEAELKELREQLAALKEELVQLKAARAMSPQYGEAVALAQQGMDAQAIAARCGISVSEAELVRALSGRGEHGQDAGS